MVDALQTVSNEFWVYRSLMRDRGLMTLELDKHLERMELVIKSAIRAERPDQ